MTRVGSQRHRKKNNRQRWSASRTKCFTLGERRAMVISQLKPIYQHSVFAVGTDRGIVPNTGPLHPTQESETVGPKTSVRFLAQAAFPLHLRIQTHKARILPVNLRYLHAKHPPPPSPPPPPPPPPPSSSSSSSSLNR